LGCITYKRKRLTIALSINDKIILDNFKKIVQFSGPICIYKQKNFCNLQITNHHWNKKLYQYWNITPRKSLTLKPPNIDGDLALAYIIGLFDGDGTCGWFKNHQYLQYEWSIVGTKTVLQWIKDVFSIRYNLTSKNTVYNKGNIYRLKYTGKTAIYITEELLKIPTLFRLSRKWNKLNAN
ncbi:hypothetical protein KKH13_04360, partial [Patescibacteria group bacterium]|nr:hypothetical protein [Patescibacteria group bacterium]